MFMSAPAGLGHVYRHPKSKNGLRNFSRKNKKKVDMHKHIDLLIIQRLQ